MKKVTIEINGKKYRLRFGYGCLRVLSEAYGIGITELFEKFQNLGKREMEFAVDFVWAAVLASGDTIDKDDVGDMLLQFPDKVGEVLEMFLDSLPKGGDDEGKPQPATMPETENP